MSDYFKDMVTKPQTVILLKDLLGYYIRPVQIKNTTYFVDHRDEEITGPPSIEARISYRHYKPRYPWVHEGKLVGKEDDVVDPYDFYYDSNSTHYKELKFFDDMIEKINKEKEIWPGVKIKDDGKSGATDGPDLKNPTCGVGSWYQPNKSGFDPEFDTYAKEMLVSPSISWFPYSETMFTE
jgi:hypothetical protein